MIQMTIRHCDHCGFENIASAFRGGVCRARVQCRARVNASTPAYLTAFFALDGETRVEVAKFHDDNNNAVLAALKEGPADRILRFISLEDAMIAKGVWTK